MTSNNITNVNNLNVNNLNVNNQLNVNKTTPNITNPMIKFENAIDSSNNGMYIQFYKKFDRLPNTQIGGLTFVDIKNSILTRAVELTASIDANPTPKLEIKFDNGDYTPMSISQGEFIVKNDIITLATENGTDILKYIKGISKV